jgi:hypothetical protein
LLVGEAALLDDDLVEAQLHLGPLNHFFLHRFLYAPPTRVSGFRPHMA